MANDGDYSDEWDEDTMIEIRRFGLEHALSVHQAKGAASVDLSAVFKDADRIVNYVLGDLTP
ncbi:MAG: hypothetical protein JNK94_08920 [Hyphomonadaceae bacterium]|nr:hypothetical protein [Hyphomonadaceae bacterium]MBX3510782.1 hypothetical protein [Hyphomonadaceae bacterium]